MCDKLSTPPPVTCANCVKGAKTPWGVNATCGSTLSWMFDCSGLTGDIEKQCKSCNKHLVWTHLLDLATLIIPFGSTYGEWLGGVTDPDLNATIKAFTGSLVINIAMATTQKRSHALEHALMWSMSTSGWVLMAQIIQDYVFHGSPNRLIAALIAGLANYYRVAAKVPFTIDSEESGGFLIFATLMAGFAGNWSMMGDNIMSRFMSTTFAGFFSFFGAIGAEYGNCLITNKLFPKACMMAALQLGVGSSLAGVIADSAFGKPVISGLVAGGVGLAIAKALFSNSTTFGLCGKV